MPFDFSVMAQREKDAILESLKELKADNIDPSGYDIHNIIDDIEDIRQFLNYEKVALVGTSFGSQWALDI